MNLDDKPMQPTPVTIVSASHERVGFQLLEELRKVSPEFTAIVPKGRRKRQRAAAPAWMVPTTPRFLKLGSGCSCCTVRSDIVAKVAKSRSGESPKDVLILSGLNEDLSALSKTFTVDDPQQRSLAERAFVRSLAVVLDSGSLDLERSEFAPTVRRIELADVVVVDASATDFSTVSNRVAALNPRARVIRLDGSVELSDLRGEQLFDLERARHFATGVDVLGGMPVPKPHPEVSRFAFLARRPFHPERLHAFFGTSWPGVLRVHGVFWVATRPSQVGMLDGFGSRRTTRVEGTWWASVPEARWPTSPAFEDYRNREWDPTYGDRRQEIVFAGVSVDEARIREALTACLLTEQELGVPELWTTWTDPFPWPPATV